MPVNSKNQTTKDQDNDQNRENELISSGVPLNRYVVFLFLLVAGCAADLITKQLIFNKLFDPESRIARQYWWIDNLFGIEVSTNQGALFGMGQGQTFWFVLLSLIAIIGISIWLFTLKAAISRTLTVALGLITGGILGNLYDRLGLWHDADIPARHANGVRDWIHFDWQGAPSFLSFLNPWPNFNIADAVLVSGAILLLFHAFFLQPSATDSSEIESDKD